MKYLILIYHNEKSRDVWEAMSQEQRTQGIRAHEDLIESLTESGELIVSEALADPSHAKRVMVRDRDIVATDGPFAEAKEHLAGFYLIECGGMETAIARAADIPEAKLGLVEVRPVLHRSGNDM